MKKKVFGRKFSRDYGSRQALFRALTRSLILHSAIKTTKAKAKAVQPDLDFLVNLVKGGSVTQNRQAYAMLGNDREVLTILTKHVTPVFVNRTGGYTRIVPLPKRAGDNAEMGRLEWVEKVEVKPEKANAKKRKSKNVTQTKEPEKKGVAKLLSKAKKEK